MIAHQTVKRQECQLPPCGFHAGDTNLRRYVGNNPTNQTDPSGEAPPETEDIKGNQYGNWKITQVNRSLIEGPYESFAKITFIPAKGMVNATTIGFVQISQLTTGKGEPIVDKSIGKGRFRATKDGWILDRMDGKNSGWYGYGNDGKVEVLMGTGIKGDRTITTIVPGSSPDPNKEAVLEDVPGDYDPTNPNKAPRVDTVFRFQTFAVARAGKDKGKIYGGISWGFKVDEFGRLTSLGREFLPKPGEILAQAVRLWDDQAKGPEDRRNSKNQLPLGPDVVLPPN
jgi:hypothetical protein